MMSKKEFLFLFLSYGILAVMPIVSRNYADASTQIVEVHSFASLDRIQPGSEFQIAVVMEFAEGWHANANPAGENLSTTELILPENSELVFQKIYYPKGELTTLSSIGLVPLYSDRTVISFKAQLPRSTNISPPETIEIPIQLRYQACSDQVCNFPVTVDVNLILEVVDFSVPVQRINEEIFRELVETDRSEFSKAMSKGYFWLFLLAFIGGIATSLTPCVYPLIPITVSIFGAGNSTGKLRSFWLSIVYVSGIAITYSTMGVVVASTGALFGAIMTNPIVVGFVSLVLMGLGFSMLGVFSLKIPNSLQRRLNRIGGVGFSGAFAMGLVAGVIAAPCTGPALASVLTYIATTGHLFLGFWLLLTYAIGMGLLFVVIGTFSGFLSYLPRSGAWMYFIENIFGIAIISVALFFLQNVVAPWKQLQIFRPILLGGFLTLFGLSIGLFRRQFEGLTTSEKLRKIVGILSTTFGIFILVGGIRATKENQPDWIFSEAEGLEIASQQNKPIFLDFYADWCGACKELDNKVYSNEKVIKKLSSEFVAVKLDFTDSSDREVKRLQEKYKIVGLPVLIFLDSSGKELPVERIEKLIEVEEFQVVLEDLLELTKN